MPAPDGEELEEITATDIPLSDLDSEDKTPSESLEEPSKAGSGSTTFRSSSMPRLGTSKPKSPSVVGSSDLSPITPQFNHLIKRFLLLCVGILLIIAVKVFKR